VVDQSIVPFHAMAAHPPIRDGQAVDIGPPLRGGQRSGAERFVARAADKVVCLHLLEAVARPRSTAIDVRPAITHE